jgi:hypothetical protein
MMPSRVTVPAASTTGRTIAGDRPWIDQRIVNPDGR